MKKFASTSHDSEVATHDRIAQRAYKLWEEAGQPEGTPERFWFQAERELGGGPLDQESIISPVTRNAAAPG
jgi:hypothetical protein